MATINLNVNGKNQAVDVDPKTPVLWVLRSSRPYGNEVRIWYGAMWRVYNSC